MARRNHKIRNHDPVPDNIERHLAKLDFTWSYQYLNWCDTNGFKNITLKSDEELAVEVEAFERLKKKRANLNRVLNKPKLFLNAIHSGDILSADITRPHYKSFVEAIENRDLSNDNRDDLFLILQSLLKFGDFIFDHWGTDETKPFIRGIVKMHDRQALWLRPINDWKPRSKNNEKRFIELARHLFDQYDDVPDFMAQVWLRNDPGSSRYRDWFVHLGQGHNLRTAKTPVKLTKKMAHHFLQAPENSLAENAIRWGQLKSLGASENAIRAINETRLGVNFDNEEFWFSYFRFIAENPMLDHRQIGPLFDFLNHQKFEETQVPAGQNQWQMAPPPQPGLTLRGRNVATLMGQMEDWHRGLGKLTTYSNETYDTAPFFGYTSKARKDSPVRWTIRQLLNAQDLQIESKMLRHCVSSYHRSCLSGRCTIWSLSKTEDGKNYKRRQTIEVDSGNTIIQCRGLANRDPKEDEWTAIKSWVKETDLKIASYLM